MQTFKQYLYEAKDISRFLKKNKRLTDEEKALINRFFTANKQASKDFEMKYGWQSKTPNEMNWNDFVSIMQDYRVGRKLLLKKTKIPGKKGEDYWPVKLKNKDFIANIPLNFETAQHLNSCKYGILHVNYCIGNTDWGPRYWSEHVLNEQKVPVYVVDGVGKWVVMILPDNKHYEVWDKFNAENKVSPSNKEPIPGFSIRKELITPALAKVYNEIREDFYENDPNKAEYTEGDYEDACEEWDSLQSEIVDQARKYAGAIIDYDDYERRYRDEILDKLQDLIDETKDEISYVDPDSMYYDPEDADEYDSLPNLEYKLGILERLKSDIEDVYSVEDIDYILGNFEERHSSVDISDLTDIYAPELESVDMMPDLAYYDILIYVLRGQGVLAQNANLNKIAKCIENEMKDYIGDNVSMSYTIPSEIDIYDTVNEVLFECGLPHPEINETMYI